MTPNWMYYPRGSATFSKARDQLPFNAPQYAKAGRGSHIWGSDDREYIDWTAALGAISLGYRDPDVDMAIRTALVAGPLFGLPTRYETELAEALLPLLPWPQPAVKFGKNGSDATSAAVRAARAITGKSHIMSAGYHGWSDWACPNRNGVPDSVHQLTISMGERWLFSGEWADIAAVIVEPDNVDDLLGLATKVRAAGQLLIFDEVLTGFRMPGFFAAKHYGVTPDLICAGKALANGLPLSFVAGPAELMNVFAGDIGYSATFFGETLSLAAGLAVVRKMQREPVIARLWDVGTRMQAHWNAEATRLGLDIPCVGIPSRSVIRYPSMAHKTILTEQMWERGQAWTVGFTPTYSHTEADVEATKQAVTESLEHAAKSWDAPACEGPLIGEAFRKQASA